MTTRENLTYKTEGTRLYPTELFYQALIHQPSNVRKSPNMKRFGLLLNQLYPYDEELYLDISTETVSNEDFSIEANLNAQQPIPVEVNDKTNRIEAVALDEESGIIIQQRDYGQDTIDSIYWLLGELQSDLSERRKKAIGNYCKKIGVFESDKNNTPEGDDTEGNSDSYGRNISIPNVSKL